MALTITANNANGDSVGIDLAAYLSNIDTTYAPQGFGYFSSNANDFSGNQFASTEQSNLLPDTSKRSIVFESGGGGNSIDYTFATHTVGGDLEAISFGRGISYNSGMDSFPIAQLDLRISGFGLVNQTASGNVVSQLITDAMASNVGVLTGLLAANALNFVGSTGADAFTGYSHNDTVKGGAGNDVLDGTGGDDTAVFSGTQANYNIIDNEDGTWTIQDTRGGTPDGTDTLSNIEFLYFEAAGQTMALQSNVAPVASGDSLSAGKNVRTTIDVLANDTDSDGTLDPATVAVVDGPDHGTFSVDATTGLITYTPTKNYVGSDSFTYTVKDNTGAVSGQATVSIDVASKLTLTSADEAFVADLLAIGPVEVDGGAGDDYLGGSSNPSTAGADIFYGGEGNDVIFGATGDDRLEGGADNDILRSGSGNDTLIGGEGDDTYGIRFFATATSSSKDSGTATIIDDDGVLWNGTIRPDPMPSGWPAGQQPPATAGFQITGTAAYVSPGVYDLTQVDDKGLTQHFAITWTGGDLSMTGVSSTESVVIKDYVNGTFGITLAAPPPPMITLDASTASAGIDLEAFIRGGFISDATGGGFPVFDNSAAFSGEEMLIGYGTDAASKYVLAHGWLEYFFGTHTVWGEIGTIEYGRFGSGSYDANGYFSGGDVELKIAGLIDFTNAVSPEAEVEATGEVHNFAIAHMYGAAAPQSRLDLFADQLDQYAQHFIGSAYDDVYAGTSHDDIVEGGGGDDTLSGGLGDDLMKGGNGVDTADYSSATGSVTVKVSTIQQQDTGSAGLDTLQKIENLIGSAFNDTLSGGSQDNILSGGDGDDRLAGNAGVDSLVGGAGLDSLYGGAGNDTLVGGADRDVMYGGADNDTFVFLAVGDSAAGAATRDTIGDFSGVNDGGGDVIDLSALDGGGVTLAFNDDGKFHGGAGDVRAWQSAGGNTFVEVDIDGDKRADMQITIRGLHDIVADDLILNGALIA